MLALPNLSQFINNLPQMSILTKYGIFLSSSFNPVKKIPELDVVYGELAPKLNLIKDVKYEKLLDFVAKLKCGTGFKASEWLNNEDLIKFNKARLKEHITSNRSKETIESSNYSDKINCGKYVKLENNCYSIINQNVDLNQQTKLNDLQWIIDENKKFYSVTSHLMSDMTHINQCNFKKSYFFADSGKRVHLLSSLKRNFQGQRRGFKTLRQIEKERQQSLWGLLARLMKKYKRDNETILKESATVNSSKENEFKAQSQKSSRNNMDMILNTLRILWYFITLMIFCEFLGRLLNEHFSTPVNAEEVKVTFNDAKGMEEAKAELRCIVEFLRNPSKFNNLGGKLPSGVLLQGPPGTGKTLLARAIAGEARVNFFHVNGSEFEEIFVGEGARRVRKIFAMARKKAPAVLFIDEIDAIGETRIHHSTQAFANLTITQLLTEMDGFVKNDRIVVIGATNRAKDLDEALLRPGRFDTKITLRKPNVGERREILQLYLNKIVSKDVDVELYAKRTIGFTGADLENLVNQAALLAGINGCNHVNSDHIDQAFDRLLLGPVVKSRERTKKSDMLAAYHESGHAAVAFFTPGSCLPVKVTIVPRGETLGHTAFVRDEKLIQTKSELLAEIDVCVGGRAAEELIFGNENISLGCMQDLEQATLIAKNLVKSYGMSKKGGLRTYTAGIMGRIKVKDYGQKAANELDEEIRDIIQESYERAKAILKKHSAELQLLADKLIEKETLDMEEIKEILTQGTNNNNNNHNNNG